MHAPLISVALLLGSQAAARAELNAQGETVTLGDTPSVELPVAVRVRVAAETGASAPTGMPTTRVLPVSWHTDGAAVVGEVAAGPTPGLVVTLRWQKTPEGAYSLKAEAQAQAQLWLGLLSLELELPDGAASLGGRELRVRRLERSAALSGLDPKWLMLYPQQSRSGGHASHGGEKASRHGERGGRAAATNAWTLSVDDDADGLQALRQSSHILAHVDIVSTEARPFSHFVACTDNWRAPNHRQSLAVRLVQPDETFHTEVTLYSGSSVPLFKARYPDGRSAALVITDHADQTAAVTLRALIGGTSDVTSPRWGQGGLLGYGLGITKALWMSSGEPAPSLGSPGSGHLALAPMGQHLSGHPPHPTHLVQRVQNFRSRYGRPQVDSTGGGRPQLDDPEVVEMADRMARVGWEIVPHSATPLRDERERTEVALEWFQRYKARTWIDHQPYTNCEALVNQGYQSGPFGIVDLLQKYGYSYAWSGIDVPPGSLNLLSPRRLDRYAPVLWAAGRLSAGTPAALWLFSTMMTYVDGPQFFKLYGKKPLDQLERERGLHIAHTYLEVFHPPTSMFAKRNLMVPGKRPGEVVLDPRLDAMFRSLATRVAHGTLWVPTLSQLGDHLKAMSTVAVRLQSDGSATVRSPQAVTGATFVLPRPNLTVLIDGQPPKGQQTGRKETTFWVDLPADKALRILLLDSHGEMVPFRRLPDGKSLLAQAHHRR